MMDQVIWWTGAWVLCAGALLASVAVFSALIIAATALANYYGQRAWNIQQNLRCMAEWHSAGCPKWYFEDGKVTQMKPTVVIQKGDAL